MKARIILLPLAAVIEFFALFLAIAVASMRMTKASYFIIGLFEDWPSPDWYLRGWCASNK